MWTRPTPALLRTIMEKKILDDGLKAQLTELIKQAKQQFVASASGSEVALQASVPVEMEILRFAQDDKVTLANDQRQTTDSCLTFSTFGAVSAAW